MSEKKVCRVCFEEIDIRARKCPHCQSFQRFARYAQHIIVLSVLLFVAFMTVIMVGILKDINDEGHSNDYKHELRVAEPIISFSDEGKCPKVIIMCKVSNISNENLHSIQYSAVFNDANGVIFDWDSDLQYSTVIDANSSLNIKIPLPRDFSKDRYNKAQVTVTHAEKQR